MSNRSTKIDGVPPTMPVDWQAWQSSPTTQSMTDTQVGIAFKIMLKQWELGSLPRSAWDLAREIKSDYQTTRRFLLAYSKFLVCQQCGKSWTPVTCECGASEATGRCECRKTKFFRIDVNSGLPLGTTEHNRREPDTTEPHHNSDGGGEAPNSGSSSPEQEAKPEPESTPQAPVEMSEVCSGVCHLLGRKSLKLPVMQHWESLLKPKVELHSVGYVLGLLKYALQENEVWARAITTVKKQDPIEYFASKFESIEESREGDERFKKIREKKQSAVQGKKPAAQGSYKITGANKDFE